ncbi:MAG: MBL fold metallo-hydrolase [Puniceicoccales bacterium]|jgi:glyoxylase-like metal-dependent hydrolase (beta-lactamase superfamily II)|nr:MBL fold metallo-hydrolase [Puniceicoccales bacterium]
MKRIPIEDNFNDVISKAQFGRKISDSELATRAKITIQQLAEAKKGSIDDAVIRALASALKLNADALIALAHHAWYPAVPSFGDGFAMFNTPFRDDITVNSYLVWDPVVKDAAIFDTGSDATEMLKTIREKKLNVRAIFITHTHVDHVAALDDLADQIRVPIFSCDREPIAHPAAKTFPEHTTFPLGYLTINTLCTWGHSPGQTTYLISGLPQPLAIVGDSLFSGSMGGSADFYDEQRANDTEKIMTLSEDTVIAPGHGPLTTVGFEKKHNPLFAV